MRIILPEYRGCGIRSDGFVDFLRAHGAVDAVLELFSAFTFTGQIDLDCGIAFAEKEILVRNEFVEGDFVVFGADDQYSPFVLNVKSGEVGKVMPGADKYKIMAADVLPISESLPDFLVAHTRGDIGKMPQYLVPKHYNVDAVAIMKAYSGQAGIVVTWTTARFRRWLESVGIDRSFCLYRVTPKTNLFAGSCTIEPEERILEANFDERRRTNPRFVYIGTCPDGCFVVLDTSTPEPSVGYVAFMEIGDESGWDAHYVRVSNSLGEFLHDSNFLDILPCDYYQACKFGSSRAADIDKSA